MLVAALLAAVASFALVSFSTASPFEGTSVNDCPQGCRCSHGKGLVNCQNSRLTHLPTEIPEWVKVLDLRGNQLYEVEVGRLEEFAELHTLQLSENRINHLPDVSRAICR